MVKKMSRAGWRRRRLAMPAMGIYLHLRHADKVPVIDTAKAKGWPGKIRSAGDARLGIRCIAPVRLTLASPQQHGKGIK